MTDIVRLVNDVSHLYEQGLIVNEDATFTCPVCKKTYKQHGSAQKHLEKQECYRLHDLFENTEYEKQGSLFFREIMSSVNPRARVTLSTFRKAKLYAPVIRFILFTSYHDVLDKGLYYSWLDEIVNIKHTTKILSEGIKESRLREFRKWLQSNPSFIDSETFLDRYGNDLIEDQHFFIRSIEKGHVSASYLAESDDFPFDEVCGKLYEDYYQRLLEMIK